MRENQAGLIEDQPSPVSASVMATIRDAGSGSARVSTDTAREVIGFAELGHIGGGQYALIRVAEDAIVAPAQRRVLHNLLIGIGVILVGSGTVLFTLRRQIVTPVHHLLATTERLEAGDYTAARTPRRTTGGEFGLLGQRLDELAGILALRERQLRTTTEHRQAVIDNLPQAIWVVGSHHRLVAANRACSLELGVPPETIQPGSEIGAFIRLSAEHGNFGAVDPETVVQQWHETMSASRATSFEQHGAEGTTFAVEGRPLPDGGYVASHSDITERRRFGETLGAFFDNSARRELDFDARVARLLEIGRRHFGLPLGVVSRVRHADYEILYAAPGPTETVPEPGTVVPLADRFCSVAVQEECTVAFEQASTQGYHLHRCYRLYGVESYIGAPLYVDGELFGALNFHSMEPSPRAFTDSDKQILRLLVQWLGTELGRERNFEHLRNARSEVAEQQAYLEAVIEATIEGIASVDATGTLVTTNAAIGRIFATANASLVGKHLPQLFVSEDRDRIIGALEQVRSGPPGSSTEGHPLEASGLRADGTPFPVELYLASMALKNTDLTLAVIRDASEAHQAETIKKQFVSTVSHELRTPLTSIVGSLGLVQGARPASCHRGWQR